MNELMPIIRRKRRPLILEDTRPSGKDAQAAGGTGAVVAAPERQTMGTEEGKAQKAKPAAVPKEK